MYQTVLIKDTAILIEWKKILIIPYLSIETSIGDSNGRKIDFRTHMISKVTELRIANEQEKKEYKKLLIELSKWNFTHYK